MLIKVKAISLTVLELQEVIVETFLTDADLLGSVLKTVAVVMVELAPLLDLLNYLSYLALLGPPAALAIGLGFGREVRSNLLRLGPVPDLQGKRGQQGKVLIHWLKLTNHLLIARYQALRRGHVRKFEAHLLR